MADRMSSAKEFIKWLQVLEERQYETLIQIILESPNSRGRVLQEAYFYLEIYNIYGTDLTESPIESLFYFTYSILYPEIPIAPQCEVLDGKYRADFVFDSIGFSEFYTSEFECKLIIECDGYEFHSSKEQITHDNERDIELMKDGWDVVHLTGTQIFKDPIKCAQDIAELIVKKLGHIERGGEVDRWLNEECSQRQ